MSTAVDDILRELAGISFSDGGETQPVMDDLPEETAPRAGGFTIKAGETRSPSVTETLTIQLLCSRHLIRVNRYLSLRVHIK